MRGGKFFAAFVKLAVAILAIGIVILVLGPFSGAETELGLNDREAHFLSMFSLSALAQLSLPWLRRRDIALICLAFAAIIEFAQPYFGRDGSLLDFVVSAGGVIVSVAPMAIEEMRRRARERGKRVKRPRFDNRRVSGVTPTQKEASGRTKA
jgi:VanZ family protein